MFKHLTSPNNWRRASLCSAVFDSAFAENTNEYRPPLPFFAGRSADSTDPAEVAESLRQRLQEAAEAGDLETAFRCVDSTSSARLDSRCAMCGSASEPQRAATLVKPALTLAHTNTDTLPCASYRLEKELKQLLAETGVRFVVEKDGERKDGLPENW